MNDYQSVVNCLEKAKKQFSDNLSAIEYMDYDSVWFSLNYLKQENPFGDEIYNYYILLEVTSGEEGSLQDQIVEYLENCEGNYEDGVIGENEQQIEKLWAIRETISLGTGSYGFAVKFDVSLGSEYFADLVDQTQILMGDKCKVIGHGHIGDGNLHLNCAFKGFENRDQVMNYQKEIEPFVFSYIKGKRGSISAEHGVGQQKSKFLSFSKSNAMIDTMRRIKSIYDPNSILNPYKVLPSSTFQPL